MSNIYDFLDSDEDVSAMSEDVSAIDAQGGGGGMGGGMGGGGMGGGGDMGGGMGGDMGGGMGASQPAVEIWAAITLATD
jgi:hypothetical protein